MMRIKSRESSEITLEESKILNPKVWKMQNRAKW